VALRGREYEIKAIEQFTEREAVQAYERYV
jgi:hypothetical protein